MLQCTSMTIPFLDPVKQTEHTHITTKKLVKSAKHRARAHTNVFIMWKIHTLIIWLLT